jgi:hypothetical protein
MVLPAPIRLEGIAGCGCACHPFGNASIEPVHRFVRCVYAAFLQRVAGLAVGTARGDLSGVVSSGLRSRRPTAGFPAHALPPHEASSSPPAAAGSPPEQHQAAPAARPPDDVRHPAVVEREVRIEQLAGQALHEHLRTRDQCGAVTGGQVRARTGPRAITVAPAP